MVMVGGGVTSFPLCRTILLFRVSLLFQLCDGKTVWLNQLAWVCVRIYSSVYFSRAGSHPCSPVSHFQAEFLAWFSSVAHFLSHKFSLSGSLIACIWVSMETVSHCCHLSTIRVITLIYICPHIHTNFTPVKLTPISSQQALWLDKNSGVAPCWELALTIL